MTRGKRPKIKVPDLPTRLLVAVDRETGISEIHLVPDPEQMPAEDRARARVSQAIAMNVMGIPQARFARFDAGEGPMPDNPAVEFFEDDHGVRQARVIDRLPTLEEELPRLRRKHPVLTRLVEAEREARRALEDRLAAIEAALVGTALNAAGFATPERNEEQ